MAQYTRQQIVNNGIKFGKDAGTIDRTLRKFGHSGLTLSEFNQISPIKDIPANALHNLGDFGAGLKTAAGEVAASIGRGTVIQDAYNLATHPGAIADAWLSTYNTSLDNLRKYGMSGLGWGVAHGISERPVEVGIDIATAGGGKLLGLGKAALAESKILNNISKTNKYLRTAKNLLLPTEKQKKISKALTSIGIDAKVGTRAIDKDIMDFKRMVKSHPEDLVQATKNVRYGILEGTPKALEITNQIKKIASSQAKKAIDLKLMDKDYHYKNTVAQHITDTLGGKQLHKDSMKMVDKYFKLKSNTKPIKKPTRGKALEKYNKKIAEDKKLIKIVENSMNAVDEGRTHYLSQIKRPTRGLGIGSGEIIGEGYFGRTRVGGKTSPEMLAPALPDTFDYLNEQIRKGQMASAGSNYLLNNMAEKATLADIQKAMVGELEPGKVLVNKKEIDEIIKRAFGGKAKLEKLISNLDSTEDIVADFVKSNKTNLPKDIYKIDVEYLEALGRNIKGLRSNKLNNFIKRALLTLPKWVLENRYSNWMNNLMDGVTFKHYGKAIELMDKAPAQLDYLTSYASFTGDALGSGMRTRVAFGNAIDKMKDGFKTGDIGKVITGVNEIFSIPITAPEAYMEKMDRLANFIKHTEDYANKVGRPFDEIFELAKNDSNLFWEIYDKTNDALGDYVGRNMFVPNGVHEAANFVYPFWRFPVESMKITGRQITNHPIKFQSLVNLPSRAGARQWDKYREEFGLAEDDFTGGGLYRKPSNRFMPYQFISPGGNQYSAIADFAGALIGTDQGSMLGINPMLTSPYKWLFGKSGYGTPARIKGTVQIGGKLYDVDEKGRILDEHRYTGGNRMSYMASDILNTGLVPYRQARNFWRPVYYAFANKDMGTPYANVLNPFQQGDIYSLQKTTPWQKAGQTVGFPITTVYPKYRLTNAQKKKLRRTERKKRNRRI